jgi:drug/metabolite transporter (DMT)-like permease
MKNAARLVTGIPRSRAWLLILLVVVAAGGGLMVSLIRLATVNGVPFVPFAFWNTVLSAALLLGVALARRAPPRLTADHLRTYASLGALAVAFPLTIFAFVAPKLPASIVAITQTLIPMMTYAMALIVAIERFRWTSVGGVGLGLAGVLLLIVPEASLPEPGMAGWVLIVLLTGFSLALAFIVAARFRPPRTESVTMAAGTLMAGALFLLPVMAIEGSWWFLPAGLDTGGLALVGQVVLYALLWFLFYAIIQIAGPVFFSANNYLVPVAGVAWGMVIFGDSLSVWVWGALALMFAGVFVLTARGGRPAPGGTA